MLSTSSRTLQTITQQKTVTHCLLFILQPIYLHNLSPHTSSQPITSRVYQRLLHLLTNQIAHQGFWIFNWLRLSLDSEDGFCQVVEMSVANNGSFQDSNHPDDLFQSRYVTPGFKPFSYKLLPLTEENAIFFRRFLGFLAMVFSPSIVSNAIWIQGCDRLASSLVDRKLCSGVFSRKQIYMLQFNRTHSTDLWLYDTS